jgi:4-amino-4-deoxy-L-arabinose transferase-like glycosyltransferase
MQSRLAESDTMLLLGVSGAMVSLAIGVVDRDPESRPPRWLSIAYFGSMGLGYLAKGPAAPALIGGGSLMFALLARRRAIWKFLLDPIGWAVFLILAMGWTVAAYRVDPGILEAMRAHNLDRFVKGRVSDQFVKSQVEDVVGHEPWLYYFYTIPVLFLPWTPWAIYGAIRGRQGLGVSRELRLLLASWFSVGLALISASAFKHKHYAIPILPPLAVASAVGLAAHIFGPRPRSSGRALVAASGLVAAGAVAIGTGLASGSSSLWTRVGPALVVSGIGYGLAFHCRRIGRPGWTPVALFGALWVVVCLIRSTVLPTCDLYRDQAMLARRANDLVPGRPPIYVVGSNYSQMVFYLRRPLVRVDDWREFARIARDAPAGAPLYAVAPEKFLDSLGSVGEVRVLDESRTFDRMKVLEIRPGVHEVARSGGTEFRR